jgi:hypothetical protein
MKTDIFDDIAEYVPEVHRQPYWRMVVHFRQLKPDDEILNIIFAMGILTFILRELPAGMIEERKAWQGYFKAFREEADRIREGSNRHMVTVSNHVEAVGKALERSGAQFMERTARIEIASREAVDRIDVEGMAQRLTARVEARVLTRFDALATTMERRYQLMEKIGEQVSRLIERLQQIHMGRMIATISAVVFVLCGGAFLAAYGHLKDADQAALTDELARVEQMAKANQEAFAALAVNDIKVDVGDVVTNGEKQIGTKGLRITPALGVETEAPDGQPKSGIIYFHVRPTFQDQIEHNQEEIERILRQYPASK